MLPEPYKGRLRHRFTGKVIKIVEVFGSPTVGFSYVVEYPDRPCPKHVTTLAIQIQEGTWELLDDQDSYCSIQGSAVAELPNENNPDAYMGGDSGRTA